jgi:hypothetical protein
LADVLAALTPVVAKHTAVIARLDRAIQYSREQAIEPRSRGVLDPPLSRGMTTVDAVEAA